MKRLLKLLTISNSDRVVFLTAFFILNFVRLGLFFLPFSVLQKLLYQTSQLLKLKIPVVLPTPSKIVWSVNVSSRYAWGEVKCLARALTTQTLMKICGYDARLQIGVAKADDGKIQAHAWIEYEGKVVIGGLSNLESYIPMQLIKENQSISADVL